MDSGGEAQATNKISNSIEKIQNIKVKLGAKPQSPTDLVEL
jgi:hypothetical protein